MNQDHVQATTVLFNKVLAQESSTTREALQKQWELFTARIAGQAKSDPNTNKAIAKLTTLLIERLYLVNPLEQEQVRMCLAGITQDKKRKRFFLTAKLNFIPARVSAIV